MKISIVLSSNDNVPFYDKNSKGGGGRTPEFFTKSWTPGPLPTSNLGKTTKDPVTSA